MLEMPTQHRNIYIGQNGQCHWLQCTKGTIITLCVRECALHFVCNQCNAAHCWVSLVCYCSARCSLVIISPLCYLIWSVSCALFSVHIVVNRHSVYCVVLKKGVAPSVFIFVFVYVFAFVFGHRVCTVCLGLRRVWPLCIRQPPTTSLLHMG